MGCCKVSQLVYKIGFSVLRQKTPGLTTVTPGSLGHQGMQGKLITKASRSPTVFFDIITGKQAMFTSKKWMEAPCPFQKGCKKFEPQRDPIHSAVRGCSGCHVFSLLICHCATVSKARLKLFGIAQCTISSCCGTQHLQNSLLRTYKACVLGAVAFRSVS